MDILTLTATPIPRTLHLSLRGIRDISVLQTPPRGRQAIRTEVCRYDHGKIRAAILPEDYVPVERERIDLYRRLWRVPDGEAIDAVVQEMGDRYGRLPAPVRRLVDATRLRLAAQAAGLVTLAQGDAAVVCQYADRAKI